MKKENVILVNENDEFIGEMEKYEAHQKGLLHRAVSVFIVDKEGNWLLQQRAKSKYHSGQLWSNACCTHPAPNETTLDSANRRLFEEMGMNCELNEIFNFTYKIKLDNEMTEHELDHVYIGITNDLPNINLSEVMNWKKIKYKDLLEDVAQNPMKYTVWFKQIYQRVQLFLEKQ